MTDLPPLDPPPTQRERRRVTAIVLGVMALVVAAAVGIWYWRTPPAAATPAKGATAEAPKGKGGGRRGGADPSRTQPVSAATARLGEVNIVQTALGTVTALRTVTVRPRVDGQLKSVDFVEGQFVPAGTLLAQIDPVPLQVQLAQVEGQLARDAAQLNNARLDLDRYKQLLAQDSIAAQQVDAQAALVRQLEGTVKVDQAQVDNARLQLSYTRITAPIGGRLGLRVVDAGNMVRSSDAAGVAVITQVDPISVIFTIPQDSLPRVLARLRAGEKPPVEAWDREQKNVLATGVLTSADNQIDVTTGTVRLKAEFPNREGKLFPNQFVNVRMVVDVRKDAVVVPSAAVQRGAQGTVVYVVKEDSTVALRPVQVGPAEGQVTAIESGVAAGERVITDGVDRIREGFRVEVVDTSAAPRGEGKAGKREGGAPKAGPQKGGAAAGAPDAAKREEFRKRLESMTPEQREEFRKRRQAREAEGGKAPQ